MHFAGGTPARQVCFVIVFKIIDRLWRVDLIDRRLYLSGWAVLILVTLRLAIGWHFFQEGFGKFSQDGFTAAGFFRQARGPFADNFRAMLPDLEPHVWLNQKFAKLTWNDYHQQVARKYGFSDEQNSQADKILKVHIGLLNSYFKNHADDIKRFIAGKEELEQRRYDLAHAELPSFREHIERTDSELRALPGDLVDPVKEYWRSLERQMLDIRTAEQQNQLKLSILDNRSWINIDVIDQIVPYFTMGVGALLLIGLFTRLASVAGAGFLVMVMSTQPPWIPDAIPIWSQLFESLGMLVLATTAAGRFAGLDFFIFSLFRRTPR